MSDNTNTKKRPNHIAYAVRSQADNAGPKYTRIGVGFDLKNGGISVLYDAIPLSGQIVLLDIASDEKPTAISYGSPTRKPGFDTRLMPAIERSRELPYLRLTTSFLPTSALSTDQPAM